MGKRAKRARLVVERKAQAEGLYQRELVSCGKKQCKRCSRGPAHGPYWYLYQWQPARHGAPEPKLRSTYIGKQLQRRIA